jgi:hypothetical protein
MLFRSYTKKTTVLTILKRHNASYGRYFSTEVSDSASGV